jgi:hypothetical protein
MKPGETEINNAMFHFLRPSSPVNAASPLAGDPQCPACVPTTQPAPSDSNESEFDLYNTDAGQRHGPLNREVPADHPAQLTETRCPRYVRPSITGDAAGTTRRAAFLGSRVARGRAFLR